MTPQKTIHNIMIKGILVNSIDSASGIFVGINNVHNWSSYKKNNYGFGIVSNSQVIKNFSMVVDNDVIDTPINNVLSCMGAKPQIETFPIENEAGSFVDQRQMIENIDVKEINVTHMDTNTSISIGENWLNGWSTNEKSNQGTGRTIGINQQTFNSNLVIDNDVIDSQINDQKQF